ncbi:MAG: FAD-binding oxidoreductase, partial [Spirochaetaceae bacterium]|nr:FAD-binding oxidoreductase [Spirochaetaceae bacterium]
MAVVVRGKLRDLASFIASVKAREGVFRKAGSGGLPPGAMNLLAARVHPRFQELRVASVERQSRDIVTYRLVAAREGRKPAAFRAGQYVACHFAFGDSLIARPFSICSSPGAALDPGFYEIAAKSYERGFISPLMAERWKPGEIVICS